MAMTMPLLQIPSMSPLGSLSDVHGRSTRSDDGDADFEEGVYRSAARQLACLTEGIVSLMRTVQNQLETDRRNLNEVRSARISALPPSNVSGSPSLQGTPVPAPIMKMRQFSLPSELMPSMRSLDDPKPRQVSTTDLSASQATTNGMISTPDRDFRAGISSSPTIRLSSNPPPIKPSPRVSPRYVPLLSTSSSAKQLLVVPSSPGSSSTRTSVPNTARAPLERNSSERSLHPASSTLVGTTQEIACLFFRIDYDEDGRLSKREFSRFLAALDKRRFTVSVANQLFLSADADGDGYISFDEYSMWICGGGSCVWEVALNPMMKRPPVKLLQEGFTAGELRCWGYTIQELVAANCSIKALRNAGFSALELKQVLRTPNQELLRAGYLVPNSFQEIWPTMKQLKSMGLTLDQLKACGYLPKDLYRYGFSVSELRSVFSGRELRNWADAFGFNSVQLRDMGFDWEELHALGYRLKDLVEHGFAIEELKMVYSLIDLRRAAVSADQLRKSGVSVAELQAAGYELYELLSVGCTSREARLLGYAPKDLAVSGFPILPVLAMCGDWPTVRDVFVQLKGVVLSQAVTANDLEESGFPDSEILEACNGGSLVCTHYLQDLGYSLEDLRVAGFSPSTLHGAGFTPRELHDAGFTAKDLRDSGFRVEELKPHNITTGELLVGFTPEELRMSGIEAANLREVGISMRELQEAGFPLTELVAIGCSAAIAKELGFSPEQLHSCGLPVLAPIATRAEWPPLPQLLLELRGAKSTRPCTPNDFTASGYSQEEVAEVCDASGFLSVPKLMELGYTLNDILSLGVPAKPLRAAGFSAKELHAAGSTAQELRESGCSLEELTNQGMSIEELRTAFSVAELRAVGVTAYQQKQLGVPFQELKEAGYPLADLRQVGFLASEAKQAGFTPRELASAGFHVLPVLAWRQVWPSLEVLLMELKGVTQRSPIASTDLFSSGFMQEEILEFSEGGEVVSPTKLHQMGYTMPDLRTAGFSVADLRQAGFPASQILEAGFPITETKDAGYSLKDMVDGGFSTDGLKAMFTPRQLQEAGVAAAQLKQLGSSMRELYQAGYQLSELRKQGCTAVEARSLGFSPADLADNGFSLLPVLADSRAWPEPQGALRKMKGMARSAPVTLAELEASGFSQEECVQVSNGSGGLSISKLQMLGYSLADLRTAGFLPGALTGFSIKDMHHVGFTVRQLREAGFKLGDLFQSVDSISELLEAFSGQELRAAGVPASKVREAAVSFGELRDLGYSLSELRDAGCLASEARLLGFSPQDLYQAGFQLIPHLRDQTSWLTLRDFLLVLKGVEFQSPLLGADLYASGFWQEEIFEFCDGGDILSIHKLQELGYNVLDLKAAGFLAGDLSTAGFRAKEMREAGFTAREVMLSKCADQRKYAAISETS